MGLCCCVLVYGVALFGWVLDLVVCVTRVLLGCCDLSRFVDCGARLG